MARSVSEYSTPTVPAAKAPVATAGFWALPISNIVIANEREAVLPPVSEATTSNENPPAVAGVPKIWPACDMERPGGSAPRADHRIEENGLEPDTSRETPG